MSARRRREKNPRTPGCDPPPLRSILKKSPGMELRDSPEEYPSSAIDRGEGESAAVSSCVKPFETLQTETTDSQSFKTPQKKRVTFAEFLSPELFDHDLPADTPLDRGASPGCPQGPSARARPEQPLPFLEFDWDEEDVEPLPELLEGAVAAEAPPAVETAEVAESEKPARITTRSTKSKQCRALAEGSEQKSGDTNTESSKDPRIARRRVQRQRNPSPALPKKSQKTKYPVYGKRNKKKGKKHWYGERKALLSPILEIPEDLSSPNSPTADALYTEDAAWGDPNPRAPVQAGGMCGMEEAAVPSPGDPEGTPETLQSAAAAAAEFSNPGLDVEDVSECFQQGEETPCRRKAKESSSLTEEEDFLGALLSGLELREKQDLHEAAQRTKCPEKDSARGGPARRTRKSSRAFFPPVENLEVTGADPAVSPYSVEEVLSVPGAQGGEGSLQGRRGRAELRVRRSMRLSRDSCSQGLSWVQLPQESPKPLGATPKAGRKKKQHIHPSRK